METEQVIENIEGVIRNLEIEPKLESDISETEEYKELFEAAKNKYPHEYEYLLHIACISYFNDLKSKDKNLL